MRWSRPLLALAVTSTLAVTLHAVSHADEGMWTFNNFPSDAVAKKYGFKPDQAWLDRVRLGSARLAQGCSASFVSASGLVMTNHHCAHECIEQLSTKTKDFVASGFFAKTEKDEVKCPALEVNQLVAITDVTERVNKATAQKSGTAFAEAQKAEKAKIEKECATSDELRCDVVELYHGGLYQLYKYRRFQDVRLVFAPELAIAFFGGDPDNFNFPRYDLDVAFLRVYQNDKPAAMEHFLPFAKQGAKAGDLTFVSGHPGRTSRELTISELAFERDVKLPKRLLRLAELRGLLTEFQKRGPEQKRVSTSTLFYVENAYKALKGRYEALLDAEFFASKVKAEHDFRAKIAADAKLKASYAGAWDNIDKAIKQYKSMYDAYGLIEAGSGFDSDLFGHARTLVRAADELTKPNEKRLEEYTDGALPGLKQELFSTAPIHPELEVERLTFALTKLREILGTDDPFVKKVLGKKSPATLAKELVRGTKLANVALRKKLFEGGKAAVDASNDPMIALAKLIDPDARALRARFEDDIDSALTKGHEAIAKARFAIYGTSLYPDATFTLRLSYGSVKGWTERGREIAPLTNLGGAFERHTGEHPYALPKSWLAAKPKLDLSTPFNMATDNDIIGGNSGSPVVNRNAEVVGLIFDGNLPSLGGEYGFDDRVNRAVAVHTSAILEALDEIYGAQRISNELRNTAPAAQPKP